MDPGFGLKATQCSEEQISRNMCLKRIPRHPYGAGLQKLLEGNCSLLGIGKLLILLFLLCYQYLYNPEHEMTHDRKGLSTF